MRVCDRRICQFLHIYSLILSQRLLTGVKIQSLQDGIKATELLHDKGVETVLITSLFYGDSKEIILLASKRDKKTSGI